MRLRNYGGRYDLINPILLRGVCRASYRKIPLRRMCKGRVNSMKDFTREPLFAVNLAKSASSCDAVIWTPEILRRAPKSASRNLFGEIPGVTNVGNGRFPHTCMILLAGRSTVPADEFRVATLRPLSVRSLGTQQGSSPIRPRLLLLPQRQSTDACSK